MKNIHFIIKEIRKIHCHRGPINYRWTNSKKQEPKQTKRAKQEEQTPPVAKPEIEFFYADPELGRLAETVELDRFEVEFPTFREGWHDVVRHPPQSPQYPTWGYLAGAIA